MGTSTEQVTDERQPPVSQSLSLANVLVTQTGISHLEAARLAASVSDTSGIDPGAPSELMSDGPAPPAAESDDVGGSSECPEPESERIDLSTEVMWPEPAVTEPSIEQFAHGPDPVEVSTWPGPSAVSVSSEREMQRQAEDEYVRRWRSYGAMLLLVGVSFGLVALTVGRQQPAAPGLVGTVWLGAAGFTWLGTAILFTTVLLKAVCRDVRHQAQELERMVRRAAARFPAPSSD